MTHHDDRDDAEVRSADEAEKAQGWIGFQTAVLFFICAVVSGYATFAGIRLFLDEVGDVTTVASGTAVLLTIAVTSILGVSWGLIVRWGPEAPTFGLKFNMIALGAALFAITLSVSSLSNVMSLAGPAAKVHDWRIAHKTQTAHLNALETRVRGIAVLRPGWAAERDKACALAGYELESGTVSGAGRGTGPVAAALSGVCQQTRSIVASLDEAASSIDVSVDEARAALAAMQGAIRDRGRAVIDREGDYLRAADALNAAMQDLRAADLLDAIDAAAAQVAASVAELSANSTFSARQIESVRGIREGLSGLAGSTARVSNKLRTRDLPDYEPVASPDYLEAVMRHALRFVPIVAAAIGIDAIYLWSLGFHLTHRAGIRRRTVRRKPEPDSQAVPAPLSANGSGARPHAKASRLNGAGAKPTGRAAKPVRTRRKPNGVETSHSDQHSSDTDGV